MMTKIAIVVPEITARLKYTLDWIFVQQLGIGYRMCCTQEEADDVSIKIDYSNHVSDFSIPNSGLLFQKEISPQTILSGNWHNMPTLFSVQNEQNKIPFDLFSAVFYLISRYEEYLPFVADKHNRYPATESILFKEGLLLRPIVDEWINGFAQLLESLGISVQRRHFQFQATFDIDIAYSYRYKGLKRNIGGLLKDFIKGNFIAVSERFNVLFFNVKDPFDSFDFIEQSHINDEYRPIYFFLCAENNTDFDKNILPQNLAMVSLIEKIDKQNIVGLHPSYYSTEKVVLLEQEHLYLNTILGAKTFKSRQHYIKLTLPKTYVNLLSADINEDYSMGYSTHLGFRAGTSRSFFWYNLVEEEQTKLTIHPFCFMDATAHYELKLSAVEAFAQLKLLHDAVQKINGQLTIVFHNFSLGTATEWSGWSKAYRQFIQMIKK